MTKRVLFLVPEDFDFESLTKKQQKIVDAMVEQYVLPMPSTVPLNGKVIMDALVNDRFKPSDPVTNKLGWKVLGIWTDSGRDVARINKTQFTKRLAPVITYDDQGNITDTQPAEFHEPHRWAGWKEW